MSRLSVAHLMELRSDRDLAILDDLATFRLLSTRQLQRLHFSVGHQTAAGAIRACTRVLARIHHLDLIQSLPRRIGGVRQGSAGNVWYLAASGERLVRARNGDTHRRRFLEPSPQFVAHTLGVAELGVQLREAARSGQVELIQLQPEPESWRQHLHPHGHSEWLKPDLFAITATGEYEDHWFLEWDTGSEHLPVIGRKADTYRRHHGSGLHQAAHGLFPAVLWVTPTIERAMTISRTLAEPRDTAALFMTTELKNFLSAIQRGGNSEGY